MKYFEWFKIENRINRYTIKSYNLFCEKSGIKNTSNNFDDNFKLCWCAENNKLSYVKYLIKKGVDVNGADNCALIHSVKKGNYEITKILLKAGANVFARHGRPLAQALENEDIKIANLLLKYDADLSMINEEKIEVLMNLGSKNIKNLLKENMSDVYEI